MKVKLNKTWNSPARLVALSLGAMCLFSTALKADWDPTDPAKWVQLPDLNPTGLDVLASAYNSSPPPPYKILADDFLCNFSGPITDIHIWGSWLDDRVPMDAVGTLIPPRFHLSIHSDIPAVPGVSHSMPGSLLWQADLLPTQSRLYATANEQFLDPNSGLIIGTDSQVWQYNFLIDPANAFVQQAGNIYWLDVQAGVPDAPAGDLPYVFGWKTSLDHWNDDAVYGDNSIFAGPPTAWKELIYPSSHPLAGQSIDMAFVLTTVPEPHTWMFTLLGVGLLALGMRRKRA